MAKVKIPKSVKDLKLTPAKFAKKHNIRVKGKKLSKKERKHNKKRLSNEYAEAAIDGLNKAVKILAENKISDKKGDKVKIGIDNVITNPEAMEAISKRYKKRPDEYPNMVYLPYMIMNTIAYYNNENISDDEKEIGKQLDTDVLVKFCERILKKPIKHYRKRGFSEAMAYQLAVTAPTLKLFDNNHRHYRNLIQSLYDIAEHDPVDIDEVIKAVVKVDDKPCIRKNEFIREFYSEAILIRASNKALTYTDGQKQLQEDLIQHTLDYLDSLKGRDIKAILKKYIKFRRKAESYKSDTKRIIAFIDHANSNSVYGSIKSAVTDLIAEDSSNELYLS